MRNKFQPKTYIKLFVDILTSEASHLFKKKMTLAMPPFVAQQCNLSMLLCCASKILSINNNNRVTISPAVTQNLKVKGSFLAMPG